MFIRAWWLKVILTPEDTKINVFNRGMWKGLMDVIPVGGHMLPTSKAGFNEEWKNVQKKERKNITSDVINKTIPIFNKFFTLNVCSPVNVDSRITSLIHV